MRIEVEAGSPESVEADVLAAPLSASDALSGPAAALDGNLGGLVARKAVDADALRTAAATVAREARAFAGSIAWLLDESLPLSPAEQARAIVDGTFLGSYDPGRWKSSAEAPRLELLVIVSDDAAAGAAAGRAGIVGEWT